MNAISGTRRAMKELVDGTIRVQIDIDPSQRAAFHKLFGEIDMPVALAPLKIGGEDKPDERIPPPKETPGPLFLLAVQWCQDKRFQNWCAVEGICKPWNPLGQSPSEGIARGFILHTCQITSRKQLDTDKQAEKRFHELIREPYKTYLESQ